MKTIVVYKSKTGFVRTYAEWIAEELSADIFEISKVNIDKIATYDTVVYGGSLYAGGIIGVKQIIKNIDKLKEKKLVVFASGASPSSKDLIKAVQNSNFTKDQQKLIKFFYLRGGFNYEKLHLSDKILMTLLRWKIILKKKQTKELNLDEVGMLSAYQIPVDFLNKKNMQEIVSYINE